MIPIFYPVHSTDDLSYNKVAFQKPIFPGQVTAPYAAINAVDKDITTCMRTAEIGKNSPKKKMWWKVDLGRVYNIYSISILFKNYNGYGIYILLIII